MYLIVSACEMRELTIYAIQSLYHIIDLENSSSCWSLNICSKAVAVIIFLFCHKGTIF